MLTLRHTAERIQKGVDPTIAIKEHCDAWNGSRDPRLFQEEPPLTAMPWIDAWLAGAAEYEAFLIDEPAPAWTLAPERFLKAPFCVGGPNARKYALVETPFAWRRRLVFSGRTMLRGARQKMD